MRVDTEQALARTKAWLNKPPGSGPIEHVAVALLLLGGWFFRARGVLFGERIEMWVDEAMWAVRMFERPLAEHLIRPPGYVLFARYVSPLLGNTEFAFRFLPWVAGMCGPVVALLLGRRLLKNAAARVLLVAIISLSFTAIEFSKEFKQYSIGLFLYLLVPLLVLRWLESKRLRDLLVVCVMPPLGLMFSQDIMFLYPGLFLLLAFDTWQRRDLRQLAVVFVAGAGAAAVVVGMYLAVWSKLPKDKAQEHWGRRYDVFYLAPGNKNATKKPHLEWLADKYVAMAALPGGRRMYWEVGIVSAETRDDLEQIDRGVWFVIHLAGLAVLAVRRRWRETLLFWSPVLVLTAVNWFGRWPIGAFRTNLFLLAGMTAIACLAFEWYRPAEAKLLSLLPVLLLVVTPLVVFERYWHTQKSGSAAAGVFGMLQELERRRGPAGGAKERLFMDLHSCEPFKYYTRYHPRGVELWSRLSPHITPVCADRAPKLVRLAARRPPRERVWLLISQPTKLPGSLRVLSRSNKLEQRLIEARVR